MLVWIGAIKINMKKLSRFGIVLMLMSLLEMLMYPIYHNPQAVPSQIVFQGIILLFLGALLYIVGD